ncbi:MAG: efflux RND transporter periplasmic adaptor subunit [Paludibacteraceae bacterium]|nr:efflux RND transporter periplasmic adaptor subunit [Paludibacteraceae bacterium]
MKSDNGKCVLSHLSGMLMAVTLVACGGSSDNAEKAIRVKTLQIVESGNVMENQYIGTIEEVSGGIVSFNTVGTVKSVSVDEGQMVRKGQVLATLDDKSARDAWLITKNQLDRAQDAFNRYEQLYKKGSLPEINYVEAKSKLGEAQSQESMARKRLDDCTLLAPYSGYVARRDVQAGNNVGPGLQGFKIVEIDEVKVNLSVPEKEISKISVGSVVPFTVAAIGGRQFKGKVTEKGVEADPLSHTYSVKLRLPNPDRVLLPGMVCVAVIDLNGDVPQILVPQKAILMDARSMYVWKVVGGKARRQNVVIGDITDRGVIIDEGLHGGDEVIVEGHDKVSQEMTVKVVNE